MKVTNSDPGPQKTVRRKPGRAPVSCAECRRLKMRCDRGNPCENCTKRGCAAICPDGTLTTGKHNKMILSNTEELHDKIESLLERIRLLEDALRALQSSVSTDPHPLLVEPTTEGALSTVHVTRIRVDNAVMRHPASTIEGDDFLDSFGTLSIGSDGETSYLGQSARADYLLNDSDSDDELDVGRLPRAFYSFCWPECSPPDNSVEETVLSFLPDLNEAYSLCEIYFSRSSWLGLLVPLETVREDFIAHVYHLPNRPWADTLPTCPHRLALLFSIFSLGALFDPAQEPNNVQSDDYYHLARVALSFKSAVLETTVYAVMAIVHMGYILFLRDSPQGHEQGWVMLGVANKLALSMGLHRDSSHWKLDKEMSEHRHTTFWQLYLVETMASLNFGRPALLSDTFIECPLPQYLDPQQTTSLDGRSIYLSWLVRFARLARHVLSELFGTRTPSYSVLLDLDSRLREFAEPDWRSSEYALDDQDTITPETMQRWCVLYYKETVFLYIHRGFLVKALDENAGSPSLSKYSQSVQACFESSYRLIEGIAWITEKCPHVSSKMGCWFGTSVSSAVVMCLLVTRYSTSELARPAMEKLDCVYSMLQNVSDVNRTAKKNLQTTRRLRNLARAAFDKSRLIAHGAIPGPTASVIPTEDINTLNRCCGKTQVRTRREHKLGPVERRRHRSSFSPEQRSEEGWNERLACLGVQAAASGTAGSSSCADDLMRFGFSGDTFNASFGHGLDSTWNNFIQQLGF